MAQINFKNEEELFSAHQEFNQLHGFLVGKIDADNGNGEEVKKRFPVFIETLHQINNQMQQYKID